MKNAVHFGAGNIGRGFIGLILSQSNFQICFADVSDVLIDELKKKGAYTVEQLSTESHLERVEGVKALHSAKDAEALQDVLFNADVITTAVGPSILPIIAKSLVPLIQKRKELNVKRPLNIIACENTIGGSDQIKQALIQHLTPEEMSYLEENVGFPNSAVDRIVPNQKNDDVLWVKVEPFYEWVIDQTQIKGELNLKGVHFTDHLEAYIERKLFTVNTGHATLAYAAHQKGYKTILEATQDIDVMALVNEVLGETGALMVAKHGFDATEHASYIKKTIERFKNPSIVDEVVRVARSPLRKLSRHDRFIQPLYEANALGLKTTGLEKAVENVLAYNSVEDPEAILLQDKIIALGKKQALSEISSLPLDHPCLKNF